MQVTVIMKSQVVDFIPEIKNLRQQRRTGESSRHYEDCEIIYNSFYVTTLSYKLPFSETYSLVLDILEAWEYGTERTEQALKEELDKYDFSTQREEREQAYRDFKRENYRSVRLTRDLALKVWTFELVTYNELMEF